MRKTVIGTLVLLASISALQADETRKPANAALVKSVTDFIGECPGGMTVYEVPVTEKLPLGLHGVGIEVESKLPYCGGRYLQLTTKNGDYWVGSPWILSGIQGSIEERLKRFAWERMQHTYQPVAKSKLVNGLLPIDLVETTEAGKVTISGYADLEGTMFFVGNFLSSSKPAGVQRLAKLEPLLKKAPSKGPQNAPVTVVEFSDFQCPSCKRAASFVPSILEKYGDKVRYTRMDLPLTSMHPWAFAAAAMGRAIHRQSPEAFWKYKEAIYSNQDQLNAFALEDFVKGFVQDHSLDAKRFEADLNSPELHAEILDSIGAAFSLPVGSTPTFLVNGQIVSGADGGILDGAIMNALK